MVSSAATVTVTHDSLMSLLLLLFAPAFLCCLCKISACPDIEVHERTDSDDVLLLACDGLWDVMSTEEAVGLGARDLQQRGDVHAARGRRDGRHFTQQRCVSANI